MRAVKKISLIYTALLCFVMLNSAFSADIVTVSGTVSEISTNPNIIVIDEKDTLTEVYGIKFNYLKNQHDIAIEPGMDISVDAVESLCSDGTTILKAISITINDKTIELETRGGRNSTN
ncbi:MAG: hypothetical protein PVI90_17090 [Desulfobacteraceae bacterium]|jgi:uncharacterized protein (UPF0218 family)